MSTELKMFEISFVATNKWTKLRSLKSYFENAIIRAKTQMLSELHLSELLIIIFIAANMKLIITPL